MPGCWRQGRGAAFRVQATIPRASRIAAAMTACWLLAGCNPVTESVDLYHDLEGGQIAAQRPPPPGAGQPYPKLGTVPPKPVMPDPVYRRSLQAQLLAERDLTERVAADVPITFVPPPPPPLPPAAAPAADAPQAANATLNTAEAPPSAAKSQPPPAATPSAPVAAATPATPSAPAAAPPAIPAGLTIVGAGPAFAPDGAGLPDVPPAPPPPASFEGIEAEPAPTPRIVPTHLAENLAGTHLYFAQGSAVLPASQNQALKDLLATRKHQTIEIVGLGEAVSDTPDGQAAAIALGLKRADAVAHALAAMRVPQSAMRLGADAFGRGAIARLLP